MTLILPPDFCFRSIATLTFCLKYYFEFVPQRQFFADTLVAIFAIKILERI